MRTKVKGFGDRQHGNTATYSAGCRCDLCRAAKSEYMRKYSAKVREETGHSPHTRTRRKKLKTITCEQCGESGQVQMRASGRFCSADCSRKFVCGQWDRTKKRGPRPRSTELVLYTRVQDPEIDHVRTSSRLTSGRCRACDGWFVSEHTDVTCSPACKELYARSKRRISDGRRRSRMREAFREDVDPQRVFEADGYRCHLCNKMTDRTKVVPHPRAPTVDHVIPLASGGFHEPVNCRTAHFMCNSVKGSRGGGEQMLLIA